MTWHLIQWKNRQEFTATNRARAIDTSVTTWKHAGWDIVCWTNHLRIMILNEWMTIMWRE